MFRRSITVLNSGQETNYTDFDCSKGIPDFGKLTGYFRTSLARIDSDPHNLILYLRPKGSSNEIIIGFRYDAADNISAVGWAYQIAILETDSNQIIEYKISPNSECGSVHKLGFWLTI